MWAWLRSLFRRRAPEQQLLRQARASLGVVLLGD